MVKKLEEEFEKLIAQFEKGDMQDLDIQQAMKMTMEFFNKLKERLASAPPEEQQELIEKINGMYKRLASATEKMAQNSGMSEDQLLAFADNPDNFTEDQWAAIQQSKSMVEGYSEEISETLNDPEFKEAVKKVEKDLKPKSLTKRRAKWIKS